MLCKLFFYTGNLLYHVIEILDQEDLCSANINLLGSGPPASNPDVHWQQKLEAAQNVLFCKELFNQLAKEAVQLQAPIPHMVVGNQIMATVSNFFYDFVSSPLDINNLIIFQTKYAL